MAKTAKSPEDLDNFAAQLEGFGKVLRDVASAMRESELNYLMCHSDTVTSVHFPAIEQWAGKIALDLKPALRALEKGVKSRAEVNKDYETNRRVKKPSTKKAKRVTSQKNDVK